MPHIVYDREDIPWTATLPTFVVVLLVVFSGGTLMLALGIYLSLWIKRRYAGAVSFPIYIGIAALCLLGYVPMNHIAMDALEVIATSVYLIAPFALRYDCQQYFSLRQHSAIESGPFWTFLFNSAYINYCLAVTLGGRGAPHGSSTSISPSR